MPRWLWEPLLFIVLFWGLPVAVLVGFLWYFWDTIWWQPPERRKRDLDQ